MLKFKRINKNKTVGIQEIQVGETTLEHIGYNFYVNGVESKFIGREKLRAFEYVNIYLNLL